MKYKEAIKKGHLTVLYSKSEHEAEMKKLAELNRQDEAEDDGSLFGFFSEDIDGC